MAIIKEPETLTPRHSNYPVVNDSEPSSTAGGYELSSFTGQAELDNLEIKLSETSSKAGIYEPTSLLVGSLFNWISLAEARGDKHDDGSSRRVTPSTMFRNLYDFLSGRDSKEPLSVPAYTITRFVGGGPRIAVPPGVTRHTYDIPSATDFIQFRAAYLMDLLGNPVVQRQVELILRDYMRFAPIRERYVLVRVGNWLGEFTVAANPPDRGTLLLEAAV